MSGKWIWQGFNSVPRRHCTSKKPQADWYWCWTLQRLWICAEIVCSNENVLGGVKRATYYGCLYVDMLWLKEELRHQGLGTRLMAEAEKIGREHACSFASVNTMDWEALSFYQKLGYEIEFVRDGYEKQSKMYLLRKNL